jgi:PPOX class probable F420-dependent enzyme
MAETLEGWALELVAHARVGHLATVSAAGEPHVVPVCFVLRDDALYIAIDEKPKSGRRLQRLRDIAATGRAALIVDHYTEDWTQLAWAQARGPARAFSQDDPLHAPAIAALRDKYPQYRAMALEAAEVIEVRAERWVTWRGVTSPPGPLSRDSQG